jgi:DHA2 family multidrug resistance protein-like MFS transporter
MKLNRDLAFPRDGLPKPARIRALVAIAFSIGIAVLDGTMINIALPSIARELGVAPSQTVWIVNAYLAGVITAVLPLASLGEIKGYRTIYRCGLVVFSIGAACCFFATDLQLLVGARFIQGLGAAGIMSVNAALVRFIFPRAQLGRGVGINAMIVASAASLGPSVAAGVLAVATWPWLFLVDFIIGGIALGLTARTLPLIRTAEHRFDYLSALLCALTLACLAIGIASPGYSLPALAIVTIWVTALALIYLLVRRQRHTAAPLFPIDLLVIPSLSLALLTSFCAFTSQISAFIAIPFFLQAVKGYSPVATGLLITPWPVAIMIMAPVAGRLADRYAVGALCMVGMSLMASGLVSLSLMPAQAPLVSVLWRIALCGAGFGLFHAPNNRAILASAPRERSGGAAGLQGTTRLLGQTTGASITAVALSILDSQSTIAVAAAFAGVASIVSSYRLKATSPSS